MKHEKPRWGRAGCHGIALVAAAVFTILLSMIFSSCRRLPLSTINFDQGVVERIEFRARVLSDPEEINQLFNCFLPDSGVLPVQVGVRNNCGRTIVIQGSSFPALSEIIKGITMVGVNDKEKQPLTPLQVMALMRGERGEEYRRKSAVKKVAGLMIPPLGAYYIYDEATAGRLFRPLADRSFYGTDDGFFLHAVTLKPGEQRIGYLYFPVSSSPYVRKEVENGSEDEREDKLFLRDGYLPDFKLSMKVIFSDSLPGAVRSDTLGFYDICFGKTAGDGAGLPAVILRRSRDQRGRTEIISLKCESAFIPPDGSERMKWVDRLNSDAELADAVFGSGVAACAVNFTRRSRVYLYSRDNRKGFIWKRDLDRNIIRLVLTGEGVFAACDNGFCYFMSLERGEVDNRYRKLARELQDLVYHRGRLYALASGSLRSFSAEKENLFDPLDRFEMAEGERTTAGMIGGMVAVLRRSAEAPRDSVNLFNPDNGDVSDGFPLPGKVAACNAEDYLLLWLDRGFLLKMAVGAGGLRIMDGTFLPLDIRGLAVSEGIIFAAGGDGIIHSFRMKTMPVLDSVDLERRVEMSPPRKNTAE